LCHQKVYLYWLGAFFYWKHFQVHVRISPIEVSLWLSCEKVSYEKNETCFPYNSPCLLIPLISVKFIWRHYSHPCLLLNLFTHLNPLAAVCIIAAFLISFLSTKFPLLCYFIFKTFDLTHLTWSNDLSPSFWLGATSVLLSYCSF
jgi:hypothetical protein